MTTVSLCGISKKFRGRPALEDVSFEVPAGSIFALLGHNGAGKSTLIGILLGQVFPDAGTACINGHNIGTHRREALASVGAIYETPAFYGELSGRENLRILARFSGPVDDAEFERAVDVVGLTSRIDDRVSVYSHGMRQRLAIAQALLPRPRLLILDEPTEGLDPEGLVENRDLILRLHREWGMTIMISSHLLPEMERLCSRAAILRGGRLLFAGDWKVAADGSPLEEFYLKTIRALLP